jgi:poly(3-hydroxybutyrate) depolymerase
MVYPEVGQFIRKHAIKGSKVVVQKAVKKPAVKKVASKRTATKNA